MGSREWDWCGGDISGVLARWNGEGLCQDLAELTGNLIESFSFEQLPHLH